MLGTFGPGFVPISGCTAPDGSLRCNPITDASCDHSMDLGVMCRKCDDLRSRVEDQCPIQVTSESIDEARTTSNLLIQNLSQIDGTCITGSHHHHHSTRSSHWCSGDSLVGNSHSFSSHMHCIQEKVRMLWL